MRGPAKGTIGYHVSGSGEVSKECEGIKAKFRTKTKVKQCLLARAWGNGLADKMLTIQERGPRFKPSPFHLKKKKRGMIMMANPSVLGR